MVTMHENMYKEEQRGEKGRKLLFIFFIIRK